MFMFYSFYQMYYYSDVQTTHTTYPDGLEVLQFPRFEYSKLLVHVSACLPQYIKNTPYLIAISASYPVSLLSF